MNLTTKLSLACAVVIGSFVLSCGQRMLDNDAHPGGDSMAQADSMAAEGSACCAPQAPAYTKLWQGTLTPASPNSPDIATGAYREVIVYLVSFALTNCGDVQARWRPDSSTPYGSVRFDTLDFGARNLVQGSHMKLQLGTGGSCTGSAQYVVAGVL